MAAWGHMREHRLQPMQFSGSQLATWEAKPRFSYLEVDMGTLPSAASRKALTGSWSPFWALTARMTVRTYQGDVVSFSSGSPARAAQAAGTGIS